ncbi:family 43 glycosylhydrolase [Micromonospora sp. WMMD1102]|uniref:family 43 glycosylhydrolase n=1 Tax=Micromonospora sp. WMMD1102 TaxID=3016105 RepID=UPI002414DC32|nr:family 43 glycosylhydrolase [Micromonospora sp. WMMD1102]MDG4785321.1 family 43 glycosylhydrolase [Micromonospora sp. WMMD1102]
MVCVTALVAVVQQPARADNPIVQTIYTADPAPLVHQGRVYLYTGHDEDGSTYFTMRDWRVFSSADMVNWTDHGSPMSLATFAWASADAWAGHTIYRNGKFYWYVPVKNRSTGRMAIGVGVSESPTGPFRDALGRPLVENGEIDPAAFIDDNGQAYLYWGNPNLWYVRLNADMISFSGGPTQIPLTATGFGARSGNTSRPTLYEEAPWVYKRNGQYYMIFAAECCSEFIAYSTGPSATGPWTYRGTIMPRQGGSFTNHPGIIDFNGGSYFFYHNGALPGGGGYTRSVAVEKFSYNADGTIPTMNMTSAGAPQIGTLDPYSRQEAETIAWSSGVETEVSTAGGMNVAFISDGDYIKVKGVGFGAGAATFNARVASATSGGRIEVRLGSATGTVVGTCTVPGTGGWQTWTTVSCPVSNVSGTHDLFLRFTGGSGNLFNVDWWQFNVRGTPTAPPSPQPTATTPPAPTPSASASTPPAGGACTVAYRTTNSWAGGFQAEVTVTAGSAPVDGWTVRWTLGAGQSVGQVWNGTASTSGSTVTVRNTSYNGALAAGGSTTFGFIAGGTPSAPSFSCTSP